MSEERRYEATIQARASLTEGLRDLGDDDEQAAADYRETKAWDLLVAATARDGLSGSWSEDAFRATAAYVAADAFLAEAKRQRELAAGAAKGDPDARG